MKAQVRRTSRPSKPSKSSKPSKPSRRTATRQRHPDRGGRALVGMLVLLLALGALGETTRNLGGALRAILATLALISLLACAWMARGAWITHRRRSAALRSAPRSTSLEALLRLTPTEFEEWTGAWLRAAGYRRVQRVGGPGDLAADLVCTTPEGARVIVQCKRYAPSRRVGSSEIQMFLGMLTIHHHADLGIFVTTAGFTAPARQLAAAHGLLLFDGAALLAPPRTRPATHPRTTVVTPKRRSGVA